MLVSPAWLPLMRRKEKEAILTGRGGRGKKKKVEARDTRAFGEKGGRNWAGVKDAGGKVLS